MKLDNVKLKQYREAKAWSQSHLAEVSGISLRTIQRIEKSGVASPESVKSLCATFDVQLNELLMCNEHQERVVPFSLATIKYKVAKTDIKATLVSFCIAFIIAFVLTK